MCYGGGIRHQEEEGRVGTVAFEWSGLRITVTSLCTDVTESRVETLLLSRERTFHQHTAGKGRRQEHGDRLKRTRVDLSDGEVGLEIKLETIRVGILLKSL